MTLKFGQKLDPKINPSLLDIDLWSVLQLSGYTPEQMSDCVPLAIFGVNPAIVATAENIWDVGGLYTFPSTSGIGMEVVSSSAADTAAGTGARTVTITGLDASFDEVTEVVTLNGVTAVATVRTDWTAVNGFSVTTAGSGATNAGNVDVRNLADTPIYSRIPTGHSAQRQAIYVVPDNKILIFTTLNFAFLGSTGVGDFAQYNAIRYNSDYTVKTIFAEFGITDYNSPFQFVFTPPSRSLAARERFAPEMVGSTNSRAYAVELRGFLLSFA